MTTRRVATVVGVVLLIAAGVAAWFFGIRPAISANKQPTPNGSVSGSLTTNVPKVTLPGASQLEADLASPKLTTQAKAIVPEERKTFLKQGTSMLPKGVTVKIAQETFRQNGKVATVQATTSAGEHYLLHLFQSKPGQSWLIVYTEETK